MKTKNNKRTLMVTSIICLLPILLSIVLYNDLPEQIAIHWNSAGVADNFMPKAWAAFDLPILFVAINIYSKIRLYNDPKRANGDHSQGLELISTWTPPVLSLILVPVTLFIEFRGTSYGIALGINVPITIITSAIIGVVFIFIGNYLPKCRQNYTIGIKLPWTLQDADNWNKTHRMARRLWMLGGFIVLLTTFLSFNSAIWGLTVIALIAIILVSVPMIYSFCLYKKNNHDKKTY